MLNNEEVILRRGNEMNGKTVKESSIIMSQMMTQQDANLAGNVHGGVIMKLVDSVAGAVAIRHSRTNVVTAAIDRLNFHHPVYIGDMITLEASVNLVGRTSMEVGVSVKSENLRTGEVQNTATAYLTLVALDENGKPTVIPSLILETDEDVRRNRDAQKRREIRLSEKHTG